ncbi:MAG TPA: cation transporter [Bacteroidales bacterium]|nr:cation transporter [Bacteroidales bacterium]
MNLIKATPMASRESLLRIALWLALVTIGYNVAEGLISIYFGISDETLSLLGFGIDSLVEVISGAGILHMVMKLRSSGDESKDAFERNALRITGAAFMLLAAGLVAGAVLNIIAGSAPVTTVPGIIISSISILTMYFLMRYKLIIGRKLESDAIVADAMCTRTCFYLSIILLASSLLYEFFRISYIDIAGSLGIAYFAVKEGIEAFQKAAGKNTCGCGDSCHTV